MKNKNLPSEIKQYKDKKEITLKLSQHIKMVNELTIALSKANLL